MKLQKLRQEKGFSQSELANAAHISKRSLQHYEQGLRDLDCANFNTILNLCIALDCRLCEILESEKLIAKLELVERNR